MKPKDIFQLSVRLFGLVFLYHGTQSLPMLISNSGWALVYLLLQFAIAWWLIGGALLLVNRAYPDEKSEPPADSDKLQS